MRDLIRKAYRGITEPRLLARECNKLYYRHLGEPDATVDIFEADWDTLIVLDACRYDVFADRCELPGRLEQRSVQSSATVEFHQQYIDGADLTDTVYVTANPQLRRHQNELDIKFHEIIDIWETGGWDDELSTVPPEPVVEAALHAHDRFPDKRLVVHFMQPHHPYIGPTGQSELPVKSIGHFWNRVRTGEIDVDTKVIQQAYEENLDIVLDGVRRLFDELDGKTVVTADHGEMMGERGGPVPIAEYGHPRGLRTPELVTVPWLVYQNGPRRTVTTGKTASQTEARADQTVRDRLRDLGYA